MEDQLTIIGATICTSATAPHCTYLLHHLFKEVVQWCNMHKLHLHLAPLKNYRKRTFLTTGAKRKQNKSNKPPMNRVNTAVSKLIGLHEQMKREKYKSIPEHALPKSTFDLSSANGLTKAIITWLELKGHYCSRLQSQGQYNPTLQKWTKGTVKRGIGDIMTIIQAKHVMIEVKYGKDKLSSYQIKTKHEVERSGGFYFVARDFDSFMTWYEEFTNTTTINHN